MTNSVLAAKITRRIEARRPAKAGPGAPARAAADGSRPRVVVVGSGYAGTQALRYLEARLPAEAADLTLVSPSDHLLYTSLLPQVCAGVVEPRHLAVATRNLLSRTVACLGRATAVDLAGRTLTVHRPDGRDTTLDWDRLVLAPGSVTRTFDIPGLREHAVGLKDLAEAAYLRDHVIRQLEIADSCGESERRARCTFVVVGAGYTGTELAAQMATFTRRAAEHFPRLQPSDVRWLLLDVAERVLPELGPALSDNAAQVLAERSVEVRMKTSVKEITESTATLTDGTVVPAHTVVWCAGIVPNPLIATLDLPTTKGRLDVDAYLRVPAVDGLFALGDAAAVPDLTKDGALTGQTAQHAIRQGLAAGRNVAASLGYGTAKPYRHHDLGFVVDLGGFDAAANPLGITLGGLPAVAATRGYHLLALMGATNRVRVAADWTLSALAPTQIVQLGFVAARPGTMGSLPGTSDSGRPAGTPVASQT